MKIGFGYFLPLLLAACTAGSMPPDTGPAVATDADALAHVGRWKLQAATDAQGRPIAPAFPNGIAVHAMMFADGSVTIEGGCNRIGANYRIDARARLVIEEIQSTEMACADQAVMAADTAVSGLLQGTSQWRIAKSYPEHLYLDHADGRRSHWLAARPTP